MTGMGKALMGTGAAARQARDRGGAAAISSPLLEDVSINARRHPDQHHRRFRPDGCGDERSCS